MSAEVVWLITPPKVKSKKPRTIYQITHGMYLQLKELESAERETGHGLAPWDMSYRAFKGLQPRGLIAMYQMKGHWGRWCLTPPGRCAIKAWET